jgi:hypothetical protein
VQVTGGGRSPGGRGVNMVRTLPQQSLASATAVCTPYCKITVRKTAQELAMDRTFVRI